MALLSAANRDDSETIALIDYVFLCACVTFQEHINFLQVSNKPLPRGLYLGYLKMKSSVDLIRVLVPKDAPNLLPHARIRDNPWVTR